MSALFSRYQCPECGAGLSRLIHAGRWPTYEMQFRPYHVPVARICVAVVAVGLALAFIHISLSVIAVLSIGYWVNWHYFGKLQCDGCKKLYIPGQFAGRIGRTIPWDRAAAQAVVKFAVIAITILLSIYLPIAWFSSKCSASCESQGLAAKSYVNPLVCVCVAKDK